MTKSEVNKLIKLNELNRSRWIFALILSLAWLPFRATAQTTNSRPAPGRYLVILETSRAMGHRSDGTIKTAANLVFSGMYGQIRQGDTIGVWTYNKDLYTGRLPLQRWSTLEQRDVCSAILNFIKSQKYEGQPAFSSARPPLEKVIKDSESITVILISSGEEKMSGTPFDEQINQLYDNWREEQQKSRMPFVTVLRAKRGTIIGYSVTPAPWQVEMPAWPAEPVAKVTGPLAPPKVQASAVPPLIVTGKKPKPTETTNTTETTAPTSGNLNLPASNPPAKVIPVTPAEPASSEPPVAVSSPGPAANPAAETAHPEPKSEGPPQTPPHPPEPTPSLVKEPVVSAPTDSPDATPSAASASSVSNSGPAAAAQIPPPPPQDISTAATTPANGLLSNKSIWIAGLGVLVLAGITLVALNRRPRSQPISLITHSLEREKES